MVTIPGASGFLGSATLANVRGISPAGGSFLENQTIDLLDVGRRINRNNVGLSNNARRINKQFLQSSASQFNAIFSLNIGTSSSLEALQTGILALRSQTPSSGLSREIAAEIEGTGSEILDDAVAEEQAAAASESLSNSDTSLLDSNSGSLFDSSS